MWEEARIFINKQRRRRKRGIQWIECKLSQTNVLWSDRKDTLFFTPCFHIHHTWPNEYSSWVRIYIYIYIYIYKQKAKVMRLG